MQPSLIKDSALPRATLDSFKVLLQLNGDTLLTGRYVTTQGNWDLDSHIKGFTTTPYPDKMFYCHFEIMHVHVFVSNFAQL